MGITSTIVLAAGLVLPASGVPVNVNQEVVPSAMAMSKEGHASIMQRANLGGPAAGQTNPFTGSSGINEQLIARQRQLDSLKETMKSEIEVMLMMQTLEEARQAQGGAGAENVELNEQAQAQVRRQQQEIEALKQQIQDQTKKAKKQPLVSSNKEDYEYIGYINEGNNSFALMKIQGESRRISAGDRIGKLRVSSVKPKEVVLREGKGVLRVQLKRSAGYINRFDPMTDLYTQAAGGGTLDAGANIDPQMKGLARQREQARLKNGGF